MEIFSHRLKWLREKKGLTQKEMAERLGITQSYYSKFEYDQREPSLETLCKLPDILDESIDFMLGKTDFDKDADLQWRSVEICISRMSMLKDQFDLFTNKLRDGEELDRDEKVKMISTIDFMGEELKNLEETHAKMASDLAVRLNEIPFISDETKSLIIKYSKHLNK